MQLIVTTSNKPRKEQVQKALQLCQEYNGYYIRRDKLSSKVTEDDFYLVVDKDLSVKIKWKDGELFYHPSISKIKMNNYEHSGHDYLIEAIEPKETDTILDLTLGLASEALLLAHFAQKVIGVEGAFPTYLIVKENIKTYPFKNEWMVAAAQKIDIVNSHLKDFIVSQPENSFDVVYCDPMFENPKFESTSLNPLRRFAIYDSIYQEDIETMLKIAKRRVVIKARDIDSIWNRINVDYKIGSKKSGVIFGVINKK